MVRRRTDNDEHDNRTQRVLDALLVHLALPLLQLPGLLILIRKPGSCNNGTSKRILDMLETS